MVSEFLDGPRPRTAAAFRLPVSADYLSRDNQINFALFHCLGPSIQTALLNAPLAVIVGWGLGKDLGLNFEIFMIVLVVLSILVVGNFLRDGKSNYLEGGLCVLVYVIIAVSTWYYPQIEPQGGSDA